MAPVRVDDDGGRVIATPTDSVTSALKRTDEVSRETGTVRNGDDGYEQIDEPPLTARAKVSDRK